MREGGCPEPGCSAFNEPVPGALFAQNSCAGADLRPALSGSLGPSSCPASASPSPLWRAWRAAPRVPQGPEPGSWLSGRGLPRCQVPRGWWCEPVRELSDQFSAGPWLRFSWQERWWLTSPALPRPAP